MDVQTIFYTLGSLFMILGIVAMIATIILLFFIMTKVKHIHKNITEKIEDLNESTIVPVKKASKFIKHLVK